eukprot:4630750-Prorocentrum_lima.AAC.1
MVRRQRLIHRQQNDSLIPLKKRGGMLGPVPRLSQQGWRLLSSFPPFRRHVQWTLATLISRLEVAQRL